MFVIKTLDPDWIPIRIQPKMLDPDPDSKNPDPKHCLQSHKPLLFTHKYVRGLLSLLTSELWSVKYLRSSKLSTTGTNMNRYKRVEQLNGTIVSS